MHEEKPALSELSAQIPFAGSGRLDRLSEKRDDEGYILNLRNAADARTLVFVGDAPFLRQSADGDDPWFGLDEVSALGEARELVLLGATDAGPRFAILLGEAAAQAVGELEPGAIDRRKRIMVDRPDCAASDLRSLALAGALDRESIAMLAQAKSLLYWHARHRYCSNCGVATKLASAGWRRDCGACNAVHFPRTDPVVIMLAVDGDRCLMGRSGRFGKGMYSALAGFLEPGETIEAAVRREIREESGIVTGAVTYLASQPWPFPASLMIGCLAQAVTFDLEIDRTELEDARWFGREDVKLMLAGRHPEGLGAPQPVAIAHHLLKYWVNH